MNKDDIILMAVEAGAKPSHNPEEWDILKIRDTDLERFAALVAAHEREAAFKEANDKLQTEISHLKTQLMRYNTNDGAYKAAFLAGQMSARGGSWK